MKSDGSDIRAGAVFNNSATVPRPNPQRIWQENSLNEEVKTEICGKGLAEVCMADWCGVREAGRETGWNPLEKYLSN